MFKSKPLKISEHIWLTCIIKKRSFSRAYENLMGWREYERQESQRELWEKATSVCVCGKKQFPGWCRYTAVLIYLVALGCLIGTQQKPQTALSLCTEPRPSIHSLCTVAFLVERVAGASSVWIVSCMTVVWKLVNWNSLCMCGLV